LIALTAFAAISQAEVAVQPTDPTVNDLKTPAHAKTSHNPNPASANYEELIITGVSQPRTRFDVIQSTSVLSQEALQVAMMPTLGETLSELPGISSTYFGPGRAGR